MVKRRDIQKLADEIAAKFSPQRIILFGSYAYGTPTPDSDVDLLVVKRHRGPGIDAACRIRCAIDADFPLDILVRSPAMIQRRLDEGDAFTQEVTTKGVVLYEADDAAVDRKGRGRFRHRRSPATVAKASSI